LVGGFFLWFNVMVNFEVGFLFDVGAFRESLSFYAKKKVTPEFRCARRGRQKGHLAPARAGQGSLRTTVSTT
jgi:hypothetical protein